MKTCKLVLQLARSEYGILKFFMSRVNKMCEVWNRRNCKNKIEKPDRGMHTDRFTQYYNLGNKFVVYIVCSSLH
jgi:hypothetical protein